MLGFVGTLALPPRATVRVGGATRPQQQQRNCHQRDRQTAREAWCVVRETDLVPALRRALYPLLVGSQAVPILVVAPIPAPTSSTSWPK